MKENKEERTGAILTVSYNSKKLEDLQRPKPPEADSLHPSWIQDILDRMFLENKYTAWDLIKAPQGLWVDSAFGDDTGIVISAESKVIITRDGGDTWKTVPVTVNNLSCIEYGFSTDEDGNLDKRFIALSSDGKGIITQDGGNTWIPIDNLPNENYTGLIYNNYVFFAVTSSGKVYKSENAGVDWSKVETPVTFQCTGIAGDGNETIIIVGNSGDFRSLYSTDNGATFKEVVMKKNNWVKVVYGENKFVAVSLTGKDNIAYLDLSKKDLEWKYSQVSQDNQWRDISYGANVFTIVSTDGKAISSFDGIRWSAVSTPNGEWNTILRTNFFFIALSTANEKDGYNAMRSSNGGLLGMSFATLEEIINNEHAQKSIAPHTLNEFLEWWKNNADFDLSNGCYKISKNVTNTAVVTLAVKDDEGIISEINRELFIAEKSKKVLHVDISVDNVEVTKQATNENIKSLIVKDKTDNKLKEINKDEYVGKYTTDLNVIVIDNNSKYTNLKELPIGYYVLKKTLAEEPTGIRDDGSGVYPFIHKYVRKSNDGNNKNMYIYIAYRTDSGLLEKQNIHNVGVENDDSIVWNTGVKTLDLSINTVNVSEEEIYKNSTHILSIKDDIIKKVPIDDVIPNFSHELKYNLIEDDNPITSVLDLPYGFNILIKQLANEPNNLRDEDQLLFPMIYKYKRKNLQLGGTVDIYLAYQSVLNGTLEYQNIYYIGNVQDNNIVWIDNIPMLDLSVKTVNVSEEETSENSTHILSIKDDIIKKMPINKLGIHYNYITEDSPITSVKELPLGYNILIKELTDEPKGIRGNYGYPFIHKYKRNVLDTSYVIFLATSSLYGIIEPLNIYASSYIENDNPIEWDYSVSLIDLSIGTNVSKVGDYDNSKEVLMIDNNDKIVKISKANFIPDLSKYSLDVKYTTINDGDNITDVKDLPEGYFYLRKTLTNEPPGLRNEDVGIIPFIHNRNGRYFAYLSNGEYPFLNPSFIGETDVLSSSITWKSASILDITQGTLATKTGTYANSDNVLMSNRAGTGVVAVPKTEFKATLDIANTINVSNIIDYTELKKSLGITDKPSITSLYDKLPNNTRVSVYIPDGQITGASGDSLYTIHKTDNNKGFWTSYDYVDDDVIEFFNMRQGNSFKGWRVRRLKNGIIPFEIGGVLRTYTNSYGTWTETKLSDGKILLEGWGKGYLSVNCSCKHLTNSQECSYTYSVLTPKSLSEGIYMYSQGENPFKIEYVNNNNINKIYWRDTWSGDCDTTRPTKTPPSSVMVKFYVRGITI